MSYVTNIKGWLEVDGMGAEATQKNEAGLQEAIDLLKCPHGWAFRCQEKECSDHPFSRVPNMFTLLPDSGDKNPLFIMFAAAINYADVLEFTEFFEDQLLKRLLGFKAVVLVSPEQTFSFCKLYKGNRKKGGWVEKLKVEFPSDAAGEYVLATNPEVKNANELARMFLHLF